MRLNLFWKANIRSTRKFREKFETLYTGQKQQDSGRNKQRGKAQEVGGQ